jgi:phospholipase/carboxylesterase
VAGASAALEAVTGFCDPGASGDPTPGILKSFRTLCRSLEILYPLRTALAPLARHFVEPAFHGDPARLDPEPPTGESVGLHNAGASGDPDARDGFTLYVPERYDGADAWSLVVALHGGYGHGRDFVWTWLREARGRGFLLLAPTSHGSAWSLHAPDLDRARLVSMVEFVAERWRVDRGRILLTGLSDGATFSLLAGLAEGAPYTHLAPVSGVLHPACFSNGNLDRASGRPIYHVHGALDWMFPVSIARMARDALSEAGADLVYRELPDLSHTYPREENARILAWLDPRLALPGDASR